MEAAVAKLFTPDVREAAAAAFGADVDELEPLGDFESYVFGYEADAQRRVLRITHPSHRSASQIEAELDWVEYLATHGVRVARPVHAPDGSFTHTIEQGPSVFHVCAFERVPGHLPKEPDWTPELFTDWGAFLGRCHALTAGYERPEGAEPRISWTDDPYIRTGRDWIPESDPANREEWDRVWGEIASLPRDITTYGICHTDLHQGNFHVHDGHVYAFDTDDCCYNWFVEDISSVFFYGSGHPGSGKDPKAFMAWAWPAFWRGYKTEHRLDQEWLDRIPLFQRGRVLTLYALIHMKFEPGSDVRERSAPKYRAMLDDPRPVLDVSYPDVS